MFHRQLRLTTFVIFDVTQPSPTSGQPREHRGSGGLLYDGPGVRNVCESVTWPCLMSAGLVSVPADSSTTQLYEYLVVVSESTLRISCPGPAAASFSPARQSRPGLRCTVSSVRCEYYEWCRTSSLAPASTTSDKRSPVPSEAVSQAGVCPVLYPHLYPDSRYLCRYI